MGVQGLVVKNPDALWVEIEDFFPPVPIRSAALLARSRLARAAAKIEVAYRC